MRISEAPVKDATGAYTRQFGVVQDITERKLNEESLQKSEHDRIKAERLAHLGYYYWDIEKREAHISEGCARIFEFPAGTSTITWDTFVKMIHPEDAVHMTGENVARMRRGEPHATEFRIILPDGTVRHVFEESEAVVRDATSGRTMQFGIIQDITERKRAEETVRLTEEKYRTIVETANESICIVDNQARLAFANNKAVKMLGYTQEEMVGHSAYEFIDREDHELLSKNLVTKRLDNKEQSNYRMRCKNGNLIWALSSSSPLYNDKGEIAGLLVMLTDITNLKLADEQLKASLKEKEALLKEVHHRVKNNLQIVTSLLNLQSSGIEDAKYISMIRDSQNRIKSMALVHEHLYKSSDLSNIDISEYLKSLVCNLSRSYCHPSGSVKFRTDLENIKMDIDKAVPIGIIVTELVSNSIKYAFPGSRKGEILVELHRDGEKNVLAISDNGVGLPAGFEIGKTGTLGLQLVEMLVQQIDGTLEIDRTERTTFRIIFVR
jgi:PAS domain S-box-containing protein